MAENFEFDDTKNGKTWNELLPVKEVLLSAELHFKPRNVSSKCLGTTMRYIFPEVKRMHVRGPYFYYGLKKRKINKDTTVGELSKARPQFSEQGKSKTFSTQTDFNVAITVQSAESQTDFTDIALDTGVLKSLSKDRLIDRRLLVDINGEEYILGKGTFGTVYMMMYKKNNVAVKKYRMESHYSVTSMRKRIINEALTLTNIPPHESIPLLFGIVIDRQPYYMVMQLCTRLNESLTLHKVLSRNDPKLTGTYWLVMIEKLSLALGHLHNAGYLHNDLKTDNIVLMKTDVRELIPVIIDFSESTATVEAPQRKYRNYHEFVDPTALFGQQRLSSSTDIYSLGIVIRKIAEILEKGDIKDRLVTIVLNCTLSPTRPSAEEIALMVRNIRLGG